MTSERDEMTDGTGGQATSFPAEDVEMVYERAGGDTWDDLLQYLESDPAEDFDDLSKHDLATMAERVRALMEEGAPYPADAEELRQVLDSDAEAA